MWEAVWRLDADRSAAAGVSDEVWGIVEGMARDLRIDPLTSKLLRQVRSACLELNLQRLQRMLPDEVGEDGARQLGIQGTPARGTSYTLAQVSQPRPSTSMGALALTVGMAPWGENESGEVWRVDAKASLGTNPVDHKALMSLIEGIAASLAVGSTSAPSQALRSTLAADFPRGLQAVERYASLPKLGVRVGEVLELNAAICAAMDRPAWVKHPELARYLQRLGDLITAELVLRDRLGRRLASLGLDSRTLCVSVDAAVSQQGKVIPRSTQGVLAPEAAISLTSTSFLEVNVDVSGTFRFRGIQADLSKWRVPMTFGVGSSQAFFRGAIKSEPSLVLQGQGAFTSWLVALMESAFDLNEHTAAMFRTVADGPDGSGSTLALTHADRKIRLEVATTLVDNGLIRLAADVVAGRLMPSDEAFSDVYEVLAEVLLAGVEDYRSARKGPLATPN